MLRSHLLPALAALWLAAAALAAQAYAAVKPRS